MKKWIHNLLKSIFGKQVECVNAEKCVLSHMCFHAKPHKVYYLKAHNAWCDEYSHDCQLAKQYDAICKGVMRGKRKVSVSGAQRAIDSQAMAGI